MEFRVLGPVAASDGGPPVRVAQRQQRQMLALLLVRAGHPCPPEWLIDALWPDRPPTDPRAGLRQVICRLRQALGPAAAGRLRAGPGGHHLHVLAGELDLATFRALAADGHAFADVTDHDAAERAFSAGLAMWTDPPLPDLPDSPALLTYRARLLDERRSAEDALADARLALGRHQQIIGQLRARVTADPLREHTRAQLCTALYRAGRKADALAAAAEARAVLSRELGVGPGPELTRLTEQILADDPALAQPAAGGQAVLQPRHSWAPVCQLPADLPGPWPPETEELAASLIRQPASVAVTVLCGPPARTTGLAVHAAHQVRQNFPGGQLYAELTEDGQPRAAGRVLAGLLASLGVPPGHIPVDTPDRASMLRSLLAGRHVLVVAAGAGDADQVLPLIPGTGRSAILITAGRPLGGLPGSVTVDLRGTAARQASRKLALVRQAAL